MVRSAVLHVGRLCLRMWRQDTLSESATQAKLAHGYQVKYSHSCPLKYGKRSSCRIQRSYFFLNKLMLNWPDITNSYPVIMIYSWFNTYVLFVGNCFKLKFHFSPLSSHIHKMHRSKIAFHRIGMQVALKFIADFFLLITSPDFSDCLLCASTP